MMHKRLVNRPILSKKAELRQISSSAASTTTDTLTLATIAKSKKHQSTIPFFKLLLTRLWDTEDIVEYTKRDDYLCNIEIENIDFSNITEPFLTANDILNGHGKKTKCLEKSDDVMLVICNIAKTWYRNGYLMKPFSLGKLRG